MKQTILEKLHKELWRLPAPHVPDDDCLDDLHTEIELSQADACGFLDTYLKSGKKKWNDKILKSMSKDLFKAYKEAQKSKDRSTLKKLKIHMDKILKAIKIMENE